MAIAIGGRCRRSDGVQLLRISAMRWLNPYNKCQFLEPLFDQAGTAVVANASRSSFAAAIGSPSPSPPYPSIRYGLSRDFDASVSIGRHGGHLAFGCPKNYAVHCCIAT
jgi:hypothetical protein